MQVRDGAIAIESVIMAIHNRGYKYVERVMGIDRHPDYIMEHFQMANTNFGEWWGKLDEMHKAQAIVVALEMYGEEAKQRV